MNVRVNLLILTLILSMASGLALAEGDPMEELGAKAAREAMARLDFEKGDENVLAMTDAGYAMIDGRTTERAIKGIVDACGCLEKDHRRAGRLRFLKGYTPRHAGNFEIIQSADQSAFDALGEKVAQHGIIRTQL